MTKIQLRRVRRATVIEVQLFFSAVLSLLLGLISVELPNDVPILDSISCRPEKTAADSSG